VYLFISMTDFFRLGNAFETLRVIGSAYREKLRRSCVGAGRSYRDVYYVRKLSQ